MQTIVTSKYKSQMKKNLFFTLTAAMLMYMGGGIGPDVGKDDAV